MDADQLIIRVDEETRRILGPGVFHEIEYTKSTRDRPGAVLLDITKAYPRVNKPLMWEILGYTKMDIKTPERLI